MGERARLRRLNLPAARLHVFYQSVLSRCSPFHPRPPHPPSPQTQAQSVLTRQASSDNDNAAAPALLLAAPPRCQPPPFVGLPPAGVPPAAAGAALAAAASPDDSGGGGRWGCACGGFGWLLVAGCGCGCVGGVRRSVGDRPIDRRLAVMLTSHHQVGALAGKERLKRFLEDAAFLGAIRCVPGCVYWRGCRIG